MTDKQWLCDSCNEEKQKIDLELLEIKYGY